jgi:uncharacterized membrane protein
MPLELDVSLSQRLLTARSQRELQRSPTGLALQVCAPLLVTARVKDVRQRNVNRLRRMRLGRKLLAGLAEQVQWRRKKRFALARGWGVVYRHVLTRWVGFVVLDMGDEDDRKAEARAQVALVSVPFCPPCIYIIP